MDSGDFCCFTDIECSFKTFGSCPVFNRTMQTLGAIFFQTGGQRVDLITIDIGVGVAVKFILGYNITKLLTK